MFSQPCTSPRNQVLSGRGLPAPPCADTPQTRGKTAGTQGSTGSVGSCSPCSPHRSARRGLNRDQTGPFRQRSPSLAHGFLAEIATGRFQALSAHHQPLSPPFATIQPNRHLAESKDKDRGETRKLIFCLCNVYSLAVVPSPPGKLQAGRQRTGCGQWPLAL